MSIHESVARLVTNSRFLLAGFIFVVGLALGYLINRLTRRLLRALGLPDTVEGTAFERTLQGLGSSTVGVVAELIAFTIYLGAALAALEVARIVDTRAVLPFLSAFIPQVVIAALVVIAGLVIGDKAALVVGERLRGIKLPEVGIVPTLIKYSIFYIAALIALGQLGVATSALLVLLAAYVFGLVFLGGLAFKDLLAAGAAGVYILLNQPYGIGDEVRIGDHQGIVQEVDVFVTRVENDGQEYIIPNQRVFRGGVVRIRG
ncbi:mechanosensitive ion channel protein MscS [Halobacteriales archaeon QS_1_68_17]|nr:MAG: mechanosensitive ion channel protein MscS [Halobacteriales archaeon QS_1_68_17]